MPDSILILKDLVDLNAWQKIQDNFSVITGVGMRTLDVTGKPITSASGEPKLCSNVLKDYKQTQLICSGCLPTFLGGEATIGKNLNYTCQAGLCNFFVPIRLSDSRVLGYVILGPVVLVTRKPQEEYRKLAESLHLSIDDFWNAFLEIKVMSLSGMQSLVELIEDLSEFIINLSYNNFIQRKEAASLYPAKMGKILNVLLDVAFDITNADIGSVMFMDAEQKHLTIRASRGLPDNIARKTRVSIGEGISGIAAKEGRSFLINNEVEDSRIKPYLNRPSLGSSMILPIKLADMVVGVMNLGALKDSNINFNPESIQAVNRLINLVTTAIS